MRKKLLINFLILLVKSLRVKNHHPPSPPLIVLVWHEELLAFLKLGSHQNNFGMLSASEDGNIMEPYAKALGWNLIRGSSNNKGISALKSLINNAKDKRIYLTADGSKGPRRVIKQGSLLAAKLSGAAICCARVKYKGFRLNTWDKHKIPYPFTKLECHYSKLYYIDKNQPQDVVLNELNNQFLDFAKKYD